MSFKSCPKCGAKWMDGQLYWSTGKPGKPEDLAGLVCDPFGDEQCINELRLTEHSGQTWEKRMAYLEGIETGMKAMKESYETDK